MTTLNRTIKPRICLSIALAISGLVAVVATCYSMEQSLRID